MLTWTTERQLATLEAARKMNRREHNRLMDERDVILNNLCNALDCCITRDPTPSAYIAAVEYQNKDNTNQMLQEYHIDRIDYISNAIQQLRIRSVNP